MLILWIPTLELLFWPQVYREWKESVWVYTGLKPVLLSTHTFLSLQLQLPSPSPDGSDILTRTARRRSEKSLAHPSRASRWPSWRSGSTSRSIWPPRSGRPWPAAWRWPTPRWRRGSRTDAPSGGECRATPFTAHPAGLEAKNQYPSPLAATIFQGSKVLTAWHLPSSIPRFSVFYVPF